MRLFEVPNTYTHAKLGASLGATAVYVAAVLVLRPAIGDSILIAVTVPALMAAWSFGARAALFASLLAFLLNVLLVTLVLEEGVTVWLIAGGALGSVALVGTGLMVGRLRDIGALLERELAERDRLQGAVWWSEARYRALFEAAPVGIAVSEEGGAIRQTNPALEKMLGRTKEELRGTRLPDYRPGGGQVPKAHAFKRLASGETDTVRYERQLVHSNGQILRVHITAAAVPSQTGQMEYLCRMVEDITERESERALQQAEAERRKHALHLASIGELAAGVAHEINAPLYHVMRSTQLLMEQDFPSQAKSDLEKIYTECKRAASVVERLLSFARRMGAN